MTRSSLLKSFARDRRGNFAMIFAIALLPMLGVLGLAVDYSQGIRYKTTFDAAADAAALAGITQAAQIINSQSSPIYDPTPLAIYAGQLAGNLVLNANTAPFVTKTGVNGSVVITRTGTTLTSTATYTATSQNSFGKMFSSPLMNIAGSAVSTYTMPKYLDIYIVVDTSQSMGIAATQTDMNNLSALTGGCVFGCHVSTNGGPSNEQIAHNHNITLRIDVIRQAIQNMIATAENMSAGANQYIRFSLYTMPENITIGDTAAHQITPITAPLSTQASAANAIDLGTNDTSGIGDSTFLYSLPDLANKLPVGGTGSGPGDTKAFLFVMTDGVQDIRGGCTDGHCTQAFDPGLCAAFKNKNLTVGVLYTTYIPFPNEQTYVDLVQPFQSSIGPNLQSCASSGFYYEASDGPAIQAATQAMFAQAANMARLSQ